MKSLCLFTIVVLCLTTACQNQKSDPVNEPAPSAAQSSAGVKKEFVPLPPSGPAYGSYKDPIAKLKTFMVYDGNTSKREILCKSFLDELELGKTDLIENTPSSDTQSHEVLRGCTRANKTGNALMLVARSAVPVSKKLEIFKLLVGKYKFPTGFASHANTYEEMGRARVDSYSVLNVVAESDELLPLTEYLISQKALVTPIAFGFGYNNGSEGDWCKVSLSLAPLMYSFLRGAYPSFALKPQLQLKTFKLLVESYYIYPNEATGMWNCTGKNRFESVLTFLERQKAQGYETFENLDETIAYIKSKSAE